MPVLAPVPRTMRTALIRRWRGMGGRCRAGLGVLAVCMLVGGWSVPMVDGMAGAGRCCGTGRASPGSWPSRLTAQPW